MTLVGQVAHGRTGPVRASSTARRRDSAVARRNTSSASGVGAVSIARNVRANSTGAFGASWRYTAVSRWRTALSLAHRDERDIADGRQCRRDQGGDGTLQTGAAGRRWRRAPSCG
jgi:hypothetical protein